MEVMAHLKNFKAKNPLKVMVRNLKIPKIIKKFLVEFTNEVEYIEFDQKPDYMNFDSIIQKYAGLFNPK